MPTRPARRRYTVSARVRAACRANLLKANAVPKSIRYRRTEKRLAAACANLHKAWGARRLRHGLYATSIERSLPWAGERPEDWSRHQQRFTQLLGERNSVDQAVARGLAEITWRRIRAWRTMQQREAESFYQRLGQAAVLPAPLSLEQAFQLSVDLDQQFRSAAPFVRKMHRLFHRLEEVIAAYQCLRYSHELNDPSWQPPSPRAMQLLGEPGEVIGNPLVTARQVKQALLPKTEKDVKDWRWEVKSAEAAPESSPVPILQPLTPIPPDFNEHLRRVEAAFHCDGETPEAIRKLVREAASASWMRLRLLGHWAEVEMQRLENLLARRPAAHSPVPAPGTCAPVSFGKESEPDSSRPCSQPEEKSEIQIHASGENGSPFGSALQKLPLGGEPLGTLPSSGHEFHFEVSQGKFRGAADGGNNPHRPRRWMDTLPGILPDPKALWALAAETETHVEGSLKALLAASFGEATGIAFVRQARRARLLDYFTGLTEETCDL